MDPKTFDAVSGVVFFVGLVEGVLPFLAKATGWTPFFALPRYLDAPLWWIVSALVIVAAVVAIAILETAKRRSVGS